MDKNLTDPALLAPPEKGTRLTRRNFLTFGVGSAILAGKLDIGSHKKEPMLADENYTLPPSIPPDLEKKYSDAKKDLDLAIQATINDIQTVGKRMGLFNILFDRFKDMIGLNAELNHGLDLTIIPAHGHCNGAVQLCWGEKRQHVEVLQGICQLLKACVRLSELDDIYIAYGQSPPDPPYDYIANKIVKASLKNAKNQQSLQDSISLYIRQAVGYSTIFIGSSPISKTHNDPDKIFFELLKDYKNYEGISHQYHFGKGITFEMERQDKDTGKNVTRYVFMPLPSDRALKAVKNTPELVKTRTQEYMLDMAKRYVDKVQAIRKEDHHTVRIAVDTSIMLSMTIKDPMRLPHQEEARRMVTEGRVQGR